jgi:hypothetical protein
MKQILNALAAIAPYFRHGSFVFAALLIFSLSSCFQQYYKTNTAENVNSQKLQQLGDLKKHFFVHTPAGSFALKNVELNNEMISGDKETVDPKNSKFMSPRVDKGNRVPKRQMGMVLEEVHLYTNSLFEGNDRINLSTNQIFRTDVYGFDRDATRKARVASIIGITVTVAAIIGIGALAASGMGSIGLGTIPL